MTKNALDWHREDIKGAVRKSGTTLAKLAVANGLERSTVVKALNRPSSQAEAIIARQLGVPPQKLWPSRYDGAGNPVTRRGVRQRQSTAPMRNGERQKQPVA